LRSARHDRGAVPKIDIVAHLDPSCCTSWGGRTMPQMGSVANSGPIKTPGADRRRG